MIILLMRDLNGAFATSDAKDAEAKVLNFEKHFENLMLLDDKEKCITCLLKKSSGQYKSLLELLEDYFAKNNFQLPVAKGFRLISILLDSYSEFFHDYVEDIVTLCLKVLRSACVAKVKEGAFQPLSSVVTKKLWSSNVPPIADFLVKQIPREIGCPTIVSSQYKLLGEVCRFYPEFVTQHCEVVEKCLVSQIQKHTLGKAKINFTILEGCFSCLAGYMAMENLQPSSLKIVYDGIKVFADPKDKLRRGFAREALNLLSVNRGGAFGKLMSGDVIFWHNLLVDWMQRDNTDDLKAGCVAMTVFYECIGEQLAQSGDTEETTSTLQFLMRYFKRVISPEVERKTSRSREFKLALHGFATIMFKCSGLIGREEYLKIGSNLAHRATVICEEKENAADDVNDDTEEFMYRIEELCSHIEALAVLGATAKHSLLLLVRCLMVELPRCQTHKRYVIVNAFKRALRVVTIESIVPDLIMESCCHSISTNLQYTEPSKLERNSSRWTYEHFVPLWEKVLLEKSVYSCFFENVLRILPNLDPSTTSIDTLPSDDNRRDYISELDVLEMPSSSVDYLRFTNICELTATVVELSTSETLPIEWCRPWLHHVFGMMAKAEPPPTGYLRIAQAGLVAAKKLDLLDPTEDLRGLDMAVIEKLLQSLSITNCTGLHQLRSALVLLHAPPHLLDETLLDVAADAFEVVLRVGKTNLGMIIKVMDILEEWNLTIDRDNFRPLCVKLLPMLNDYLCSSGISDNRVLGENAPTTRYMYASRKKRLLAKGTKLELEMLQQKIMRFLGKLDSLTVMSLASNADLIPEDVPEDVEEKQLNDLSHHLKISLPCPTQRKLDIYLDSLIPRIKDLALNSTSRDTKVTACQTLHSIILILYGTCRVSSRSNSAALSSLLSDLTLVMVALSADTDTTVSEMFRPLLIQTCHWLAPTHAASAEAEKFSTALMKGAYHPTDSQLRETSCEALREYVMWTVKKSSDADLQTVYSGPATIVRAICQAVLHPDPYKKRGAFLIFNRIASQLYRIDSIIDVFLLKVLHTIMICIERSSGDRDGAIYKAEAERSLDVMLRCLTNKSSLFKRQNQKRRIPYPFGQGCLEDVAHWLLTKTKFCRCRKMARKLFSTLTEIAKKINGCASFINNKINTLGVEFFDSLKGFNNTSLNGATFDSIVNELSALLACIDTQIIILQYVDPAQIYSSDRIKNSQLFTSLRNLNHLYHGSASSLFFPKDITSVQRGVIEDLIFCVDWKFCQFIFELFSSYKNEGIEEDVRQCCETLPSWLLRPRQMQIFMRNTVSKDTWTAKRMIDVLKQNLNSDNWKIFEGSFVSYLNSHKILELLAMCSDANALSKHSLIDCLEYFVELFDAMDCEVVFVVVKQWHLQNTLDTIFIKFNSILNRDPSSVRHYARVIDFILGTRAVSMDVFLHILFKSLNSDFMDVDVDAADNSDDRNRHVLKAFHEQICSYIIKNHEEFFRIIKMGYDCNMVLVEALMRFRTTKRCQEDSFVKSLAHFMIEQWPLLEYRESFDDLLKYYSLLSIVLPDPLSYLGVDGNNMRSWLLRFLEKRGDIDVDCSRREIQQKARLLYLLPTVSHPGVVHAEEENQLTLALGGVMCHFPQRCEELAPYTVDRSNFLAAFKALLEAAANSGSYTILKCIIRSSCADKEHACASQIAHKLRSFMDRTAPKDGPVILSLVLEMLLDRSNDPSIRINLLNNFLVPMLRGASIDMLETFYAENVFAILGLLDKRVDSVIVAEIPLKHLFVEWNISYQLADVMFSMLPTNLVDDPTSKIGSNNTKWKKEFFNRSLQCRSVLVPPCDHFHEVQEYLRMARCSAFKCLHSITLASPSDDIRLYMFLIDHKKASSNMLWEGMIDTAKRYTFPIDQTFKLKYQSVRVKHNDALWNSSTNMTGNSSTNMMENSFSQSVSGVGVLGELEDRRRRLFSQSLMDDPLKYDMHLAVIRDAPPQHQNTQMQNETTMVFEDSDLNNHEIMGTVCAVLKDMDRITSSNASDDSTPEWVKRIAEILGDSSKHSNIRLFLSQVVVKLRENNTDIFKKYSREMIQPLLKTICDRHTFSDNAKIDLYDVSILLLLLSWKDTVLSLSESNISLASDILKLLISQIDPNLQSPHLYRHTLQILKDILSVWGQHLKIPSETILAKLASSQKTLAKAGVQISAAILSSDIQPWTAQTDYETFIAELVKSVGYDDKTTYKPAAELLGMTLHSLVTKDTKINDIEPSRYDKLLKQLRKLLKDMYQKRSHVKFITCLYLIQKYHVDVCDETFANLVTFLMPKFPGDAKTMCLKIFLVSMNGNRLESELTNLGLKSLLKDRDYGLVCLHVINKACANLDKASLRVYLDDVCDLVGQDNVNVRTVTYEILMQAYDIFENLEQTPANDTCMKVEDISAIGIPSSSRMDLSSVSRKRPLESTRIDLTPMMDDETRQLLEKIKGALLGGLDDENAGLKRRLFDFWSERLNYNLQERWLHVTSELTVSGNGAQGSELGRLVGLVLGACRKSPDYETLRIFDNPLEKCDFVEYNLDGKRRTQGSTLVPRFAETLNTQMEVLSLKRDVVLGHSARAEKTATQLRSRIAGTARMFSQDQRLLRATLESQGFTFSEANTLGGQRRALQEKQEDGFSLTADSSLLFTLEPQLLHRRTYKPLPQGKWSDGQNEETATMTSEKMLRRKMISDKNLIKAKFSGIAAEMKKRKEQDLLAEKPAPMFRGFRDGDYPDIQIGLDTVLAPILGLATRDGNFSKDLFIAVFRALVTHDDQTNFKSRVGEVVVSRLKERTGTGPHLSTALLELYRICLRECLTASSDCRSLVREVSKANGVDWLGQLLLEEADMEDIYETNSKIKRVEDGVRMPSAYYSKIKSLKCDGRWEDLQRLYEAKMTDDALDNAEKKYCAEEYFHCLSRLSDWDTLVGQLGHQLSPEVMDDNDSTFDSSDLPGHFDYDLLWRSARTRDTFLHLVMAAHVQRVARIVGVQGLPKPEKKIKEALKATVMEFENYVNKWLCDGEKCAVLNDRFSPWMSLWKGVSGQVEYDVCDAALKWLREAWTRDNSGETLGMLQTVAETRNFLETFALIKRGASSDDAITSSLKMTKHYWSWCLPDLKDDTVLWDVRLACRTVFTSHLQSFIRSRTQENEEDNKRMCKDFSKGLRMADLHLVKAAIAQKNFGLSKKYIDKHYEYLEEDEELCWDYEFTKFYKLKAERETISKSKTNFILEAWYYGENLRGKFSPSLDPETYVGLLINATEMADMMCLHAKSSNNPQQFSSSTKLKECMATILSKADVSISVDEICSDSLVPKLVQYSASLLQSAVRVADEIADAGRVENEGKRFPQRRQVEFIAETYMTMVRFCRKAKEDYVDGELGVELLGQIVCGVLRAMAHGHMEARRLFPVLILELEQLPSDHPVRNIFSSETKKVPVWMFLPWSAQIFAHLPSLQSLLLPLARSLAKQYPAALAHHYRLSRAAWTGQGCQMNSNMDRIIQEFDNLLIDNNVEKLVSALGWLRCPWTLLKSYLEKLNVISKQPDSDDIWNLMCNEMITELFSQYNADPNCVKGDIFNKLEEFKSEILSLEKLKSDGCKFGKGFMTLYDRVCVKRDKMLSEMKRAALSRFSPFLANYGEDYAAVDVEVFGQYEGFHSTPPNLKNHVTIARFHNEISMLASVRRPVRVSLYGSDGRRYTFLVKCLEDLRQDDRIQQLFHLMNHPLREAGMNIVTYKVIPLTHDVGLIEWVNGCALLGQLICHTDANTANLMAEVAHIKYDIPGNNTQERICYLSRNTTESVKMYRSNLSRIPKYLLRDALQRIAVSPENFVLMKNNFVKSLAPMNVAHWILGIGDRHLSNCMVSLTSGNVVGIDFGLAFGTATQQQSIPELMPFRLSPQILGLLAPQGPSGLLRELMWQCLNRMCQHRSLLLAAMRVFVQEPSLNWLQYSDDNAPSAWSSANKIDQCRRKLNGVDPSVILMEDLRSRKCGTMFIEDYCKIVREAVRSIQNKIEATGTKDKLTVDQQVDILIELATNHGIMSVTYKGWYPWF